MFPFHEAFRQHKFIRQTVRGVLGLAIFTPVVAVVQGGYLLSDFRENHRNAPFPEMPCSGVVVVRPKINSGVVASAASSWFASFPLLYEQKDPDPLRLLVVGDSLAAGVGTTKQGTPVLPEAIAKSLSRALGGRAVHWTCMGEPGLSSPQIVKELLLAESEEKQQDSNSKERDVLEELQGWWQEKRQQQQQKHNEENGNTQQAEDEGEIIPKNPEKIRAWWQRTKENVEHDVQYLKEKIHWRDLGKSIKNRLKRIPKNIPQPPVLLNRRKTVVADIVAQYDIAVVVTGFNDIKNLIFPVPPPDPETIQKQVRKQKKVIMDESEEKDVSGGWFEKDLYRIMSALKGKMRNYEPKQKNHKNTSRGDDERDDSSDSDSNNDIGIKPSDSLLIKQVESRNGLVHRPMVVFPANPHFAEKVYPLIWFANPMIEFMEQQKKKLAETYPAPVLFLEGPSPKTISDYVNERGPYWEASKNEDVLLKITNKAQHALERVEKLMKEYYDMWTIDMEEAEPTYVYDVFGPDIEGPLVHLHGDLDRMTLKPRSPLISPDKVHPSDEGYELWGRHIADAIVKEWDRQKQENTPQNTS